MSNPILVWLDQMFSVKVMAECGHSTYERDYVHAHGGSTVTALPVYHHGKFEYCHQCLGKMAIQCAKCGEPIFIGDGVALGVARDDSAPRPKHSQTHTAPNGTEYHILCLRYDCGHDTSNMAGFWVPPGVISLLHHGMTRATKNRAGKNKPDLFFKSLLG